MNQWWGGRLSNVVVKEVVDLETLHVVECLGAMLASDSLPRFLKMHKFNKSLLKWNISDYLE